MPVKGAITALDIHEHKVRLIEQNAKRLHVADVIDARALDARKVGEQFEPETFDKILVDALCSGLGLMRRKLKSSMVAKHRLIEPSKIQLAILEAVAPTCVGVNWLTVPVRLSQKKINKLLRLLWPIIQNLKSYQ